MAQLLDNVAYIGKSYPNRTKREGELLEAAWDALVDQETWKRVQRLKSRYHRAGGRTGVANERQYVFQGLLRCTRCGSRMHCHTIKEVPYYNCRGNDRVDPCKRGVREDALLPWAERLFAALDEYRPEELPAEVDRLLRSDGPAPAPDALAQLDRNIERLGHRFEWGHIDEMRYRQEWDRLQAMRRDLVSANQRQRATPPLPLDGLMEAWQTGDPVTRRELLLALFEELDVEERRVVAVVPRKDRAAEVADLLDRVQKFRRCSPGGDSGRRPVTPGDSARTAVRVGERP